MTRKHTTNGLNRYQEATAKAIAGLDDLRALEAKRIRWMNDTDLGDERAELFYQRAFNQRILGYRNLETAIREWRVPSFAEFAERKNVWCYFNALTTALRPRVKSNPQAHAGATIRLGGMLCPSTETVPALIGPA